MGNVHVLHQEVVVAYNRLALGSRASRDRYILADTVVVTNEALGVLTFKLQVLRLRGEAGTGKHLVVVAYPCTVVDGDAVVQYVVVAENGVLVDKTERTNNVVVAEFCIRINECQWAYLIHSIILNINNYSFFALHFSLFTFRSSLFALHFSLFIFDDLCCEGCLRHDMISHEHVAFHGTDAVAYGAEELDTEEQCVARYHLMTELHVIDLEEVG